MGMIVLALIIILLYDPFSPGPAAVDAEWVVDPDAKLGPTATSIPIVVNEMECASGRSATGRIEVEIAYGPDEVGIEVGVRPLGGDQNCPSNPNTPYIIELSEPLGDRSIEGERPLTG